MRVRIPVVMVLATTLFLVAPDLADAGKPAERAAQAEMTEGVRAARHGYWLEALSRFERANELRPNHVRTLNNLAVALEAVGRYEDAKATYEAALKLSSGDRSLRRNHQRFEEFYETNIAKTRPTGEAEDEDDSEGGKDDD